VVVTEIEDKHDAFAASDAALTKSGTSTLELALAGVPMLVTYRVNPITAAIARRLVKVRYAALVNLLADREVVPELIQEACTPDRLATVLETLLTDPDAANTQRAAFRAVLDSLRPAGNQSPSDAAAAAVLALLDQT
jgi:lipid-A-disaccharide synthase